MKKTRISLLLLVGGLLIGLTACNGSPGNTVSATAAPEEESGDADVVAAGQDAGSATSQGPSDGNDDAVDLILNSITNEVFSTEPIAEEDLEIILQSGATAPSGMNLQTWHFTVVTGELMSELARFAVDGNVVIVVSGEDETVRNPYIDCSLATENMNLAAQALGYGARIYTSTATNMSDEMKAALEIPEGYTPITVLQIGHYENYVDAVSSASTRNPLDGMVNYIGD